MMQAVLQIGNQLIPPEALVPFLDRHQVLPYLKRELIVDEAIASIHCPSEEVISAYRQLVDSYAGDIREVRQSLSERYQLSEEEVDALVTRSWRIEKFKLAKWGHQLESYFLKRKHQLDQVIYSLIRLQSDELACELYFRLNENEQTFAELAQTYSEGLEAKMGGFVGPISIGNLHPGIARILTASQPGQLHLPQLIDRWYVILRLEEYIPARLDESMRQQLLQERFDQWIAEQI